MPELQRLRAAHASAALLFETANRACFTAFISDHGDGSFEHFAERYDALRAEQEAGLGTFHVLAAADGAVAGRFNLVSVDDGGAKLGYRVVAQHVSGRGVATATVRDLCRLAASEHGFTPSGLRRPARTLPHDGCCSRQAPLRPAQPIRTISAADPAPGTSTPPRPEGVSESLIRRAIHTENDTDRTRSPSRHAPPSGVMLDIGLPPSGATGSLAG